MDEREQAENEIAVAKNKSRRLEFERVDARGETLAGHQGHALRQVVAHSAAAITHGLLDVAAAIRGPAVDEERRIALAATAPADEDLKPLLDEKELSVDERKALSIAILFYTSHQSGPLVIRRNLEVAIEKIGLTAPGMEAAPAPPPAAKPFSDAFRGSNVEAFIKRHRRQASGPIVRQAIDDLLEDYRLHADTGTPLSDPTPSDGGV